MTIQNRCLFFGLLIVVPYHSPARAQGRQEPGHSIGRISTQPDLIVMELDEGVLGKANLFDLVRHTLRFTPEAAGYRVENTAFHWDPEFGAEMPGAQLSLRNFAFPFSGKSWDSLSIGVTGSIAFGAAPAAGGNAGGRGGRGGGITIGRFDQLSEAAHNIVNTVPAICVFMKPRMSGTRYVKESADRLLITWDLTEPVGGIQDFTWVKTINRFQAALLKDGSIEMSYDQVAAKDAIVGVYPLVRAGDEKALATLPGESHPNAPAHIDIKNLRLSVIDGLYLKATFETRGPVLAEGDAALAGVTYRMTFHTPQMPGTAADVWTIRGVAGGGRAGRGGGAARYMASGPYVAPGVKVDGNTISVQGLLPASLRGRSTVNISADSQAAGADTGAGVAPSHAVGLSAVRSPEADLSSLKKPDGPFPIVYESFHYLKLPNARDLTCTVIKALGDKFDFLAYYSDFRIDNQEAGTPSNGPVGGVGGDVTGIGQLHRGSENYCSAGRFQWQFVQPVYSGSNQMQERPPEGMKAGSDHNVDFYDRQLGERSGDGHMLPYNYAISQIGHEMGHRWSAFVSAKVNGETIQLGPTHWARGLHAPAPFPYQRPSEASAMGGGVWQDNLDGTFTQLDDDYYVPATGWSYLDLYLMGLITPAEVPDFFMLRNLVSTGRDANGHPIFKADRVKVTVQDVIAVEGPRLPGVEASQKKFNTGMVVIVEHGAKPSRELIENTKAIRLRWMDYWETTTGHRSSMTANPR